MLPIIEEEFTVRRRYLTKDEFTQLVVVAQSLPGPIAVNTSALVGFKLGSFSGALVSVVGALTFPFLTILAIAAVLDAYYSTLEVFLKAARLPVFAILIHAIIRGWSSSVKKARDLLVFSLTFVATALLRFNPVLVLICVSAYALASTHFRGSPNGGGGS